MTETKGILNGVRVLDLSRMLSGPYCTMMLADHGAEVIKIESGTGDTSRANGPFRDDDPDHLWAGYFVSLNRSKKSVTLDLKTPDGKAAFCILVRDADVLVENFRPGVMERLGLSYEYLATLNPRLVYGAVRGFGDPRSGQSPYADWPCYDVVAQAMGGLMAITGPDAASPTKVGPGVGDIFSGMIMAFGLMAALRHADATGAGQFVDVAMYDAMISLCERAVYLNDFTETVPGPEGNNHPFLAPFGLFGARDGAVALGIVDDAFWRALAGVMQGDALVCDSRFSTRAARAENRQVLNTLVGAWTAQYSKAELTQKLGGLIPYGPLQTVQDMINDPHVAARNMLSTIANPDNPDRPWQVASNPLRFGAAPMPAAASPPKLGADNAHYLTPTVPPPMSDQNKKALREAFGSFATGITVVATRQADGTRRGFTANSFTSVSLDPPLVLICIAKTGLSYEVFRTSTYFSVNVLSDAQRDISKIFASQSANKFDLGEWTHGAAEMPVLRDALANFICQRENLVEAGDHVIMIGRVLDMQIQQGAPLGYFKGNYFSVGLDQSLISAVPNPAP
ncbi:CoA transferase [Paracoccaceae bacterium]|nr:CoA transferase [Paracoccaceae bacterium]